MGTDRGAACHQRTDIVSDLLDRGVFEQVSACAAFERKQHGRPVAQHRQDQGPPGSARTKGPHEIESGPVRQPDIDQCDVRNIAL